MSAVLGVVQCRLDSRRLPGKALLPLAGKTVLEWVLARCLRSGRLDRLVLATTRRAADEPVARLGRALGLPVVRGPVDNLLSRFAMALRAHPADVVVRITADNPLTAPEAIDAVVDRLRAESLDYCYATNIPYGAGADAFAAGRLLELAARVKRGRQAEHINRHFLDNHLFFAVGCVRLSDSPANCIPRLTLDTPEDYERLKRVFARLPDPESTPIRDLIQAALMSDNHAHGPARP